MANRMGGNGGDGSGGRQFGGGSVRSDMGAPGGSSGSGGYGKDMQGQEQQGADPAIRERADPLLDRGDALDEAQGGGRSDQSVVSRGWVEAQGEGGGLDPQMGPSERGAMADAETEQDAEG